MKRIEQPHQEGARVIVRGVVLDELFGDFEARFALAAILAYEGDFNAAFDHLLEVVLRDKAEWREKARKQLVEWFDACPDPAVVSRGRRYLGMYLN